MIRTVKGKHYRITINPDLILEGQLIVRSPIGGFLKHKGGNETYIPEIQWREALKVEELIPIQFYGYYNRKMKTYFACMTPDLKGVDLEPCEGLTEIKYLPESSL